MAKMPELPHFSFPFQRGAGGKVEVVEQQTDEHVGACVSVISRCPLGFRHDRPEFGWDWPEFRSVPLDVDALAETIRRFEPRADLTARELTEIAELVNAIRHGEVDVVIGGEEDVDG